MTAQKQQENYTTTIIQKNRFLRVRLGAFGDVSLKHLLGVFGDMSL